MSLDQFFARGAGSLKHAVRAFRHPNYRLFFFGQGVSLIGTWMQTTALGWLIYQRTGSKMMLGRVAFASQIPSLLLMPLAGALADRMNRRPILIVSQSVAMLQAFLLTWLVVTDVVEPWHIEALAVLVGITVAFDMPARQAFVVEMLGDRRDLQNAIALNSVMFNSARFIGPALAGLLIYVWGEGPVFAANGLSYLAVIAAYAAMQLPPRRHRVETYILHEIRDGFLYVFRHRAIRQVLLMIAFFSLVAFPYITLIPVFARDALHGDERTNGWLLASIGFGAIGGALYLASRRDATRLIRVVLLAGSAAAVMLALFSRSSSLWASVAFLAATGFCQMAFTSGANTAVQTLVTDDKRGRLMGFYGLSFIGVAPFGNLLTGAVAQRLGAPNTVLIAACLSFVAMLLFAIKLRHVKVSPP